MTRWRVYQFVTQYLYEHGWAPTCDEIAAGCGLAKSTAHAHLRRLGDEGWLRVGHGPRMIALPYPMRQIDRPATSTGDTVSLNVMFAER